MAHANATVEELVSQIERGELRLIERVITWIPSSSEILATHCRIGGLIRLLTSALTASL